jgi:hypothetical protein
MRSFRALVLRFDVIAAIGALTYTLFVVERVGKYWSE